VSADRVSRPAAGESQCPVCLWPDQGLTACDRCGLELRAGYVVGLASPADEAELAGRIAAARLRYDLRAAIRVASQPGERDYQLLERLGQLARGGPPLPHERDRALAEFDAESARVVSAATGLGFTLSRLVAREIEAIEFVEIGPESISAETLVVDDRYVPVRVPPGQSTSWRSAVAALAADDELRLFQLAGGPVPDPAALTRAAETAAAQAVRQRLRATSAAIRERRRGDWAADEFGEARIRRDTVLVRRTDGWPLLEAAIASARAVMRPVAEIVDSGPGALADVVDRAGRRAPLRYGYDLALAKVNPRTGEVRPDRWPLFKPGTVIRRHSRLTENAFLAAPPSAADQLALPVVMRHGATTADWPGADWPAVGMATMPGSTQGTTQLTVRLLAPGRVSFQGTPDVVSQGDGSLSWPRLLAGLPDSVPAEIAVDLVLLVELGGGQDEVAGRVALAADTVKRLHRTDARIALIGYRDHYLHAYYAGAATARDSLIVGCGLEEISRARSVLASSGLWQAVEARDDYAAPLEDALAWIEQEDLAWRPDARHLLVVLGRRPPHPVDIHDQANPATVCPHHHPWREILGRLRLEHMIELVAIRDEAATHGPAGGGAAGGGRVAEDKEHAWQEFCAEGSFARVDASSADDLLAATKLAAAASGSPLPLAMRAAGPANHGRAGGA
jgi:hypothetical protein